MLTTKLFQNGLGHMGKPSRQVSLLLNDNEHFILVSKAKNCIAQGAECFFKLSLQIHCLDPTVTDEYFRD